MTDGIIQEVIGKHIKALGFDDIFTNQELSEVRQELIEKIKQEINEQHINGFDTGNLLAFSGRKDIVLSKTEVLEKLIGDNQE